MNRKLVTIRESSSCHDAVGRMHRARVRHLPVVSRDGTLVGIVTDRDVRHHLFSPNVYKELGTTSVDVLLNAVAVGHVMSSPVITVDAGEDVSEAARIMREERVGALAVLEGGRLAGIITETDLLREICRADAACSSEVTDVVVSYP